MRWRFGACPEGQNASALPLRAFSELKSQNFLRFGAQNALQLIASINWRPRIRSKRQKFVGLQLSDARS
jgi:hypothetical protein